MKLRINLIAYILVCTGFIVMTLNYLPSAEANWVDADNDGNIDVPNEAPTISQAISWSTPGMTIEVEYRPIYHENSIVISSEISIIGYADVITGALPEIRPVIGQTNPVITISAFTVNPAVSSGVVIENFRITPHSQDGINTDVVGIQSHARGLTGCEIKILNCDIRDCNYGIVIDKFEAAGQPPGPDPAHYIIDTINIYRSKLNGIYIQTLQPTSNEVDISNCIIWENDNLEIPPTRDASSKIFSPPTTNSGQPAGIYVEGSGTDITDSTLGSYDGIQAGNDGCGIYIKGNGNTVDDCLITKEGKEGIYIEGNYNVVEDSDIEYSGQSISSEGIEILGDFNKIIRCDIHDSKSHGIKISGDECFIKNCGELTSNQDDYIASSGIYNNLNHGIFIAGDVEYLTICDSYIHHNFDDGMRNDGGYLSRSYFFNVAISGNNGYGVCFENTYNLYFNGRSVDDPLRDQTYGTYASNAFEDDEDDDEFDEKHYIKDNCQFGEIVNDNMYLQGGFNCVKNYEFSLTQPWTLTGSINGLHIVHTSDMLVDGVMTGMRDIVWNCDAFNFPRGYGIWMEKSYGIITGCGEEDESAIITDCVYGIYYNLPEWKTYSGGTTPMYMTIAWPDDDNINDIIRCERGIKIQGNYNTPAPYEVKIEDVDIIGYDSIDDMDDVIQNNIGWYGIRADFVAHNRGLPHYIKGGHIVVEDCDFRNLYDGIHVKYGDWYIGTGEYHEISGSTFTNCQNGIVLHEAHDTQISYCDFTGLWQTNSLGAYAIVIKYSDNCKIRVCEIANFQNGINIQASLNIFINGGSSSSKSEIKNCANNGLMSLVYGGSHSTGKIQYYSFTNINGYDVILTGASSNQKTIFEYYKLSDPLRNSISETTAEFNESSTGW